MSLIEVVITLFIFSISITLISNQVNRDMLDINHSKNTIAEIYSHGL